MGVVKSWDRIIVHITLAMMHTAQMPLPFWGQAAICANYLNRSPTKGFPLKHLNDPSIYRKILALQYYISPERSLYPDGHFWRLLGKAGKGFTDSVAYVVTYKAHCMEIWGRESHPEYANLSKLSALLTYPIYLLSR